MRRRAHSRWSGPRLLTRSLARVLAPIVLAPAVVATCLTPALLAPASSAAAELPDGRGYELVSPVEKSGNEAGFDSFSLNGPAHYGVATADGGAVLYSGTGPIGATTSGFQQYTIAQRATTGWASFAALPGAIGQPSLAKLLGAVYPAADLGSVAFIAQNSYVAGDPDTLTAGSIYRATLGGALAWVGEPTLSGSFAPSPPLGSEIRADDFGIAGGSPDLDTVYFVYDGTLLPQDADRAAHIPHAAGFYEWSNGVLTPAGVLPDGSLDPYGAIPASIGTAWHVATANDFNNEVSADGSRAFFVSPTPSTGSGRASQLYVREPDGHAGKRAVLISRSNLSGEPSADGPSIVNEPDYSAGRESYVFASPDGSRAYFASIDRLTADAPNDGSTKEYVYDLSDDTLSYLAGVEGPIVGSTKDGSRFLFDNPVSGELDLCVIRSGGSGGCQVTSVTPLPQPDATSTNSEGRLVITSVRAAQDGSAFVFQTDSPLPGAFNNAGGYTQVYRYEIGPQQLTCISCPPGGRAPSGDANISNDDRGQDRGNLVPDRGISSDAREVFFDTPDQLVRQDVNTARDVYEWKAGTVSLISAGSGPDDSFFIDNSASGADVFFASPDGLVSPDTDGGYDVYDAQIGGGAPSLETAVGCIGEGCQSTFAPTPNFVLAGSLDAVAGENFTPPPVARAAKQKTNAKPKPKTHKTKPKRHKSKAKKHKAKGKAKSHKATSHKAKAAKPKRAPSR